MARISTVVGVLRHQAWQAAGRRHHRILRQRCIIYTLILGRARVSIQAKAGITKEIGEHMTEHSKVLSKGRKKRVMPEGLATVDEIEKLGLLSSHPLHKSTKVGSEAMQR